MTFESLQQIDYTLMESSLMSSAEAFPARTSVSPERVPALAVSDPACGQSSPGSLARYDPATCSWRTSQLSLFGGLTEFSETWPRSGMMRSGRLYPRHPWAPRTAASASGLWRTPNAGSNRNVATPTKCVLEGRARPDQQIRLADQVVMASRGMWPTPRVEPGNFSLVNGKIYETSLQSMARRGGWNLPDWVAMWPTPTTVTDTGGAAGAREKLRASVTPEEMNGALNPQFVEWLMGFSIDWTKLE